MEVLLVGVWLFILFALVNIGAVLREILNVLKLPRTRCPNCGFKR